jgi:hypothetical protein
VRSTVAKPSNGQAKNKSKGQSSRLNLRRLTKRQKEKIYRIATIVFLLVFAFSIVGTLVAVSVVRAPGQGGTPIPVATSR